MAKKWLVAQTCAIATAPPGEAYPCRTTNKPEESQKCKGIQGGECLTSSMIRARRAASSLSLPLPFSRCTCTRTRNTHTSSQTKEVSRNGHLQLLRKSFGPLDFVQVSLLHLRHARRAIPFLNLPPKGSPSTDRIEGHKRLLGQSIREPRPSSCSAETARLSSTTRQKRARVLSPLPLRLDTTSIHLGQFSATHLRHHRPL